MNISLNISLSGDLLGLRSICFCCERTGSYRGRQRQLSRRASDEREGVRPSIQEVGNGKK